MLGWLFPRPPIAPVEKAWIETRMLWLARGCNMAFAPDNHPVDSADEFIPTDYDGTLQAAGTILTRMCQSLKIPEDQFQLQLAGLSEDKGESPERSREAIPIDSSLLNNPYAVAAAAARGLALRHLSVQTPVGAAGARIPWLADVAAICLGWGTVVSHVLARDAGQQQSCGCGPGGCDQPRDLLPARMQGYALALFAYIRGEKRFKPRDPLQSDALAVGNRALRYLRRTGDSLFTVERMREESRARTTEELLNELNGGSASARIVALWELRDADRAPDAVDAVAKSLRHRLPDIREEAAKTLVLYGPAAQDALPHLLDLLYDNKHSIRAAAATALAAVGSQTPETLAHVASLLRDPNPYVVYQAAKAVETFGAQGEEAIPEVFAALRSAVVRCDHQLIDALIHTLYTLDPDPTERVMDYFNDDPELRQQVAHIIHETF